MLELRSPFFVGATVVSVETVGVEPNVTRNVGGGVGGGVGEGVGMKLGSKSMNVSALVIGSGALSAAKLNYKLVQSSLTVMTAE